MSKPQNNSQRRKSFGQWDKTNVVNVNQKYYVNKIDKYTDAQKETFTRWVNIQLRSIHRYDFLNSDNNSSNESLADKLPEIKEIEKDFRDGTRLIKLLEVIYEGDSELPKRERGNTRHHHIANVSNVLNFLKNRLDESGLAALQAIGPVDIVDGNVKLTLGLIWLIISKFHQMVSVFKDAVTEEELAIAKAQSGLLNSGLGDDEDHEKLEQIEKNSEEKEEKSNDNNIDNHLGENPVNVDNNSSIHHSKIFLNPKQNVNIMNNYNRKMSLPEIANKDFRLPPKRFRTLRLNDSSASLSSSSGLLFWLNMQLVDYASVLPSSSYPIEDLTGLNNGVLLSALIHHKNPEWFEDFDLLVKDPPNDDESAIKERLQKCFNITEEKLGVEPPKALISILIENKHQLNKEQINAKAGVAWNAYISEVDDNINNNISISPTAVEVTTSTQPILFNEPPLEERDSLYSTTKGLSMASSPLSPLPPWSPKKLLVNAVWDWATNWMTGDNLNYDEHEDGEIDNSNENEITKHGKRESKTFKATSSNCDYEEDNNRNLIDKNLIGIWNIQNQANINFKPTTTALGKISKLKIHVLLDSTVYTAGTNLSGRLVVSSLSSRSLKLGEISVELTAYEELTTREYTASQSFLSSRLVFQSSTLPPSNAVYGPKEDGFWTAKKGKTTFPFAFKIPIDAPSCVTYGNNACLKYIVTGVVQYKINNKEDSTFKSKEAFVVEAWDINNPIYKQPVEGMNMRQLWLGGSGAIMLEARLVETFFQSGANISVQIRVKNETKRRVQGIKVAITHKLHILANKTKKELDDVKVVGETVKEEWYKNKDFLFDCGEDRITTVHIDVPKNVRTIRNTALFEVVCYVVVSLYLGLFTKDLIVYLPVFIAHSSSSQPPPIANIDKNVFPNHYNMIDENADFFVEDFRKDDDEVLGQVSSPVNIPSKKGSSGILPWSNVENDGVGKNSPKASSPGSVFISASPKKLGSFASSILNIANKPKQMSPTSPSKLIHKSPPLAPASPYAYIPAFDRVRYLSFTTQEQGQLQNRPYDITQLNRNPSSSKFGGFGTFNDQMSPPTSEYEFIPSPPDPSSNIEKWLENQNNDSSPEFSKASSSPWSHLNKSQEIINASPHSQSHHPKPIVPFGSISSPTGPSGLTLLMRKQLSPPLPIQDYQFNEPALTISQEYSHVPRGRRILGFKRAKRNQSPNTTLIKIEGVTTKEETQFYLGKRVAFVYRAKREKNGSKIRVIWGRVSR
nr:13129_t:CDS:10 [Entrophospora candida]